jgi:hypothetical protein
MREIVAHLIVTLDGVVKFDVVLDTIVKQRDTEEVLAGFPCKSGRGRCNAARARHVSGVGGLLADFDR